MSFDLITFGETMVRLSPPDRGRLETAETLRFRTAGAESNVAIAASRLGAETAWISKLADSPLGRRVVADVRQHGVEPAVVWSEDERQGTYFLEHGNEPRGTTVVYDRSDAAVTTATPDELATDVIKHGMYYYTSGITPALANQLLETSRKLLKTAIEAGTTTVFDVNYRSKLWKSSRARKVIRSLFPLIDVVIIALRDAQKMLNIEGDAKTIAIKLERTHGFETVLVTRGHEGVLALSDGEVIRQEAFETETLDPIGTGDAFVGGFLAAQIQNMSLKDALEQGAATAALKRTLKGDLAVVTQSEVDRVRCDSNHYINR